MSCSDCRGEGGRCHMNCSPSTMERHRKYLVYAEKVAQYSRDPSTKVGAILFDHVVQTPVAYGFNRFADGVEVTEERLNDRAKKYPLTLHAEVVAIDRAMASNNSNHTLYVTHPPCARCASYIAEHKVRRVVAYAPTEDFLSRWADEHALAQEVLKEAGVEYVEVER